MAVLVTVAALCLLASPCANAADLRAVEPKIVDMPLGDREPPLRLNLQELMRVYKVPALSVAVVDDFKIVAVKAYGALPTTLFQAGSISKPVAAAGALYLVEHGKLSLDEDVNKKLKTWKVPENELTKTEKVTLRRLLSHTAGLTVHGFPGYDVDEPVPTLVQIFNGEKPANTAPIRVDLKPGSQVRYSGGGITIEQQLMIDVTGKPFPQFMRDIVLGPIGMDHSSYEQPLPPALAAQTTTGTRADGTPVHGRWHIYPEMAAAGLWTTPADLCKFAIEIALSKQGKANHVLSEKMTREMLTPVMDEAALGFFLDRDRPGQFGHNGADEGFQAILTMNAESGKGAALMANSDNGIAVANWMLGAIAKEYGWKKPWEPSPFDALLLIARVKSTDAALRRYDALKKSWPGNEEARERTLNGVGYTLLQSGQVQDSIVLLRRNVQEFPKSSNVYDTLGEAYVRAGQKELAIENYQKSLELDPKNRNAAEILKKLRATN